MPEQPADPANEPGPPAWDDPVGAPPPLGQPAAPVAPSAADPGTEDAIAAALLPDSDSASATAATAATTATAGVGATGSSASAAGGSTGALVAPPEEAPNYLPYQPEVEQPAGDADDEYALMGEHGGGMAAEEGLLHQTASDLDIQGGFEADILAIQAQNLPGRSAPGSKRRTSIVRRLGWGFWVAAGWCLLMILTAILAPVLPISGPNQFGCIPNSAPVAGHLLGCDRDGRDVLARLIYGGQVSLVVGFASIALALAVGGTLAVIAGYLRGIFDSIMGILTNVLLAYPYLVLGLAIVTFWGNSEFQVTIVIAIVAVAPLYRVVRANTIAFAERDYVLAAMALGSTRKRILWKQIVPDVIPTAITYALVGVAIAVIGEGALSYLGESVSPTTTPTWGNMIADGSTQIPYVGHVAVNIWSILSPGIAMFAFILAINVMGDRLRSVLDVREGVL